MWEFGNAPFSHCTTFRLNKDDRKLHSVCEEAAASSRESCQCKRRTYIATKAKTAQIERTSITVNIKVYTSSIYAQLKVQIHMRQGEVILSNIPRTKITINEF